MKFDPSKIRLYKTRLDEDPVQAVTSDEWEISSVTSTEAHVIEIGISETERSKRKVAEIEEPEDSAPTFTESQARARIAVIRQSLEMLKQNKGDLSNTLPYIESKTLGMPNELGHFALTEKQRKLTDDLVEVLQLVEDWNEKKTQMLATTPILPNYLVELGIWLESQRCEAITKIQDSLEEALEAYLLGETIGNDDAIEADALSDNEYGAVMMFMESTGQPLATSYQLVRESKWDAERAVNKYLDLGTTRPPPDTKIHDSFAKAALPNSEGIINTAGPLSGMLVVDHAHVTRGAETSITKRPTPVAVAGSSGSKRRALNLQVEHDETESLYKDRARLERLIGQRRVSPPSPASSSQRRNQGESLSNTAETRAQARLTDEEARLAMPPPQYLRVSSLEEVRRRQSDSRRDSGIAVGDGKVDGERRIEMVRKSRGHKKTDVIGDA
jgi:hypothetical protein